MAERTEQLRIELERDRIALERERTRLSLEVEREKVALEREKLASKRNSVSIFSIFSQPFQKFSSQSKTYKRNEVLLKSHESQSRAPHVRSEDGRWSANEQQEGDISAQSNSPHPPTRTMPLLHLGGHFQSQRVE